MVLQSRRNIIVIGGNFAGLAAARALDSRHFQVTLLDPGPDFEWYPNLHELVSRHKRPGQLRHARQKLMERLGHRFQPVSVSAIDRRQQRVLTQSGQWLAYDDVVLALGNGGNLGMVPGAREHALPFDSIAGAERVVQQLQRLDALSLPVRPVVLIGAGFEGLEILGEMARRYRRQWRFTVHVVDPLPSLMPAYRGVDSFLKSCVRDLDIQWHLGRKAASVGKDEVLLDDGTRLASRLTLWCGGGMPHPLPVEAGLAEHRQYAPVDPHLRSTLDEHVWIAGNAARFPTPLDKQAYHALAMGQHVAANLRRLHRRAPLKVFRPMALPKLLSFGETGLALFKTHAIAHPGVIAAKEAVYQANFHRLSLPRQPEEWSDLRQALSDSLEGMGRLALTSLRTGRWKEGKRFEATAV